MCSALRPTWLALQHAASMASATRRSSSITSTTGDHQSHLARPQWIGAAEIGLYTGVPDAEVYRTRLRENIAAYDMIDGKQDWRPTLSTVCRICWPRITRC